MGRPTFAPKITRGPIPKLNYLPHLCIHPNYHPKLYLYTISRFATMHWTVRQIDTHRPTGVLAPQGEPWPKVTGLGGGVYQPSLATCNVSSRFDDHSPKISAAKLRRFRRRCDPQKYPQKHTVNDRPMSPHYMRRLKLHSFEYIIIRIFGCSHGTVYNDHTRREADALVVWL